MIVLVNKNIKCMTFIIDTFFYKCILVRERD